MISFKNEFIAFAKKMSLQGDSRPLYHIRVLHHPVIFFVFLIIVTLLLYIIPYIDLVFIESVTKSIMSNTLISELKSNI